MFARSPAVKQYAVVGVESKVLAADPHRLIALLYDGAIEALGQAVDALRRGRHEARQRMVGKAVAIIVEGLRTCLDREHGGEIAAKLDSLYEYLIRRIFDASRNNDEAGFAEAIRLLGELRGAWAEIDPDLKTARGAAQGVDALPVSGSALSRAFALA